MSKAKKIAWFRRRGMKKLIPGGLLVGIIVLGTLLSLIWTPYNPNAADLRAIGVGPLGTDSAGCFHVLGTDQLGRDMLSRVMVGGQLSLLIAILAVFCSALIGTVLGVASAYYEGWFDHFMGMIVEVQHSIPMLLIIVLVLTLFGSSIWVLAGGLAISEWFSIFRQTRAKTLVQKKQDYTLAAKVLGASNARIIFAHLLPNVLPTTIVFATLLIGTVILRGRSELFGTWCFKTLCDVGAHGSRWSGEHEHGLVDIDHSGDLDSRICNRNQSSWRRNTPSITNGINRRK